MKNKKNMIWVATLVILTLVFVACSNNQKNYKDMNSQDDMKPSTNNQMMEEETVTMDDEKEGNEMMDGQVEDTDIMNDGDLAPNFTLMDTEGNTHSLEEYKGQKVYLKFWASWCPICLAGLEELDQLAGEAEDFAVLTIVSPDYNGEKSKEDFVQWFNSLDTKNITVLLDVDGEITREYGVRGYPTSSFVGSDGVLVLSVPGHKSNEEISEIFHDIY